MSKPFPQNNPLGGSGSTPDPRHPTLPQSLMLQTMLEGFVDGVLIVSLQGEILQANRLARQICQRLQPAPGEGSSSRQVPATLWMICRALLDHYHDMAAPLIPEQDAILGEETVLRVRLQGFPQEQSPNGPRADYLLITLEDRYQTLHNQAIADMQRYGLTRREAQVWLLRLRGLEYRAIAQKLYISENTVKKHMKSVFAKQRSS